MSLQLTPEETRLLRLLVGYERSGKHYSVTLGGCVAIDRPMLLSIIRNVYVDPDLELDDQPPPGSPPPWPHPKSNGFPPGPPVRAGSRDLNSVISEFVAYGFLQPSAVEGLLAINPKAAQWLYENGHEPLAPVWKVFNRETETWDETEPHCGEAFKLASQAIEKAFDDSRAAAIYDADQALRNAIGKSALYTKIFDYLHDRLDATVFLDDIGAACWDDPPQRPSIKKAVGRMGDMVSSRFTVVTTAETAHMARKSQDS